MVVNSKELHLPYKISIGDIPTLANKTGSWRFLTPIRKEKEAPCRGGCPLENGIPYWMEKVKAGDFAGAWSILEQYNPFPTLTGYVCYNFCEGECNRAKWDEEIAIQNLEKDIGIWRHEEYNKGKVPDNLGKRKKEKIAVIGSGPAGLSSAYYLQKTGFQVTIYEKLPLAGGMLAVGIPEYRLPRAVLLTELAILKSLGVEIRTGIEIGKDIKFKDLKREYDAVISAPGAHENKVLGIDGEGLKGVMGAMEYLKALHLGEDIVIEDSVVVIGGGNVALDAATCARFRGAKEVTLVYRRSREDMPAHASEIKAAEEAGVNFIFQGLPTQILGQEKVTGIEFVRTKPSKRGETAAVIPDSKFVLTVGTVISAVGQETDLTYMEEAIEEDSPKQEVAASAEGVFIAGDAAYGPENVPAAIFSGRKTALAVASYLGVKEAELAGIMPPRDIDVPVVTFEETNPYVYPIQGRFLSPVEEANRCLSCGHCNKCGICWVFCPDTAVEEEKDFEIKLDYCKGCGICVKECPGGVLEMEGS